jgi:small subunit ribosomal protein S5
MSKSPIEKEPVSVDQQTPSTIANRENDAVVAVEPSEEAKPFEERVISVDRVSRTQKGGRRLRFRALVVIGDRHGNVGLGIGKSNEITSAVAKATYDAKKHIVTVPIVRETIPHEIVSKFDTAKVMLKPATQGTSVIAGGSVRPILELAGINNVVGKCLTRTTNKLNNAYATMQALRDLKDIKEVAPRRYKKPVRQHVDSNKTVVKATV